MSAPHDYESHGVDGNDSGNGVNDHEDQNQPQQNVSSALGSQELPPVPPPPSISGGASPEQAQALALGPAPSLQELAKRALQLCWGLLVFLARHFVWQPLSESVMGIVSDSINQAQVIVRLANRLASGRMVSWLWRVPIAVLLIVSATGGALAATYLDMEQPINQRVVEGFRTIERAMTEANAEIKRVCEAQTEPARPATARRKSGRGAARPKKEERAEGEADKQGKPQKDDEHVFVRPTAPAPKRASVVKKPEKQEEGTVKERKEDDEEEKPKEKAPKGKEPPRAETALGADAAKQSKKKESGTKERVEKDDKRDKAVKKAQQGKAREQPATATGGAVKREQHPPQPAAAVSRLSAEEALRAAMSVEAQPSSQAASSEALLAAKGSSQEEPSPSKPAGRRKPKAKAKSKAQKGMLFFNLFFNLF